MRRRTLSRWLPNIGGFLIGFACVDLVRGSGVMYQYAIPMLVVGIALLVIGFKL